MSQRPLLDLAGRTALVTGGSRGVGRATALYLAQAGASVGIVYRTRERGAREVVEGVQAHGVDGWAVQADLSRLEEVEALKPAMARRFQGLDILVSNHGVWPPSDVPLSSMTWEQWRTTLRVNLDSVFLLLREMLPTVNPGGAVVVVTSTAAQRGEAFHGDYAASKGGLQSLVKGLAVELAPRDIRVNAVAPGWIDTEMAEPVLGDGGMEDFLPEIPLGRVADPEDVAGPIAFLSSPLARHVTGEILNVNGGVIRPG